MSKDLRRRSSPLTQRQHGAVSRRQLRDAGLSLHQIERGTRSGELVRDRYAVYGAAGAPWSWHRAVLQSCLAAGGYAFRRTAGRLYELDGCRDQRIEILVPHSRRVRQSGLKVCRTRFLPDDHVGEEAGIPVTSVARTLADLGSCLSPRWVERALEDALRRKLVRLEDVIQRTRQLRKPGRRGPDVLWRVLVRRGLVIPTDSGPELSLGRIIDHPSLPPHERQYSVRTKWKTYRIDFAYPSVLLGVEYDGSEHLTPLQVLEDKERDRRLASVGWLIARFSRRDLRSPRAVRNEIGNLIAARESLFGDD